MEEIRIPFVLWFSGEAPPSLAAMTAPLAIAVAFHSDGETTLQGGASIGQRAVAQLSDHADD
jgi:hypothetical protein